MHLVPLHTVWDTVRQKSQDFRIAWSCLHGAWSVAESDHYVLTAAGDSRGPTLSHLLPATDSTERWGWVSLVARIQIMAFKREQEENSEADDSPHKQTLLFRHCKYVTDQWHHHRLKVCCERFWWRWCYQIHLRQVEQMIHWN